MSNYSKFLDDLNNFYTDRKLKGIAEKISNDDALAAVRDKWLDQGKLTELISFIHTNWDSGNCDDFIEPLAALLVRTNQIDIYKILWIKIIKYRLTALRISVNDLKRQSKTIDMTEIEGIDTSTFKMFSRESYTDLKRVLAFRRQFAIDGLTKFRVGLLTLNQTDDSRIVSNFINEVMNLKPSTFKLTKNSS